MIPQVSKMIYQASEMTHQHCKMIKGVKYKALGSVYVFVSGKEMNLN